MGSAAKAGGGRYDMKRLLLVALLIASTAAADSRPSQQPWLGLAIRPFRDKAATRMLHVERVVPNGPGDRAGVRPGDIIVKIDGHSIQHIDDLDVLVFIGALRPGQRLRLDVVRTGAPRAITLAVGQMPESARAGWERALTNARRARLRAQTKR